MIEDTIRNPDGTYRVIEDLRGNKWHVHSVLSSSHGFVQVNICTADGRPVRPEGGIRMPRHIAEQWIQGKVRVHLA